MIGWLDVLWFCTRNSLKAKSKANNRTHELKLYFRFLREEGKQRATQRDVSEREKKQVEVEDIYVWSVCGYIHLSRSPAAAEARVNRYLIFTISIGKIWSANNWVFLKKNRSVKVKIVTWKEHKKVNPKIHKSKHKVYVYIRSPQSLNFTKHQST